MEGTHVFDKGTLRRKGRGRGRRGRGKEVSEGEVGCPVTRTERLHRKISSLTRSIRREESVKEKGTSRQQRGDTRKHFRKGKG